MPVSRSFPFLLTAAVLAAGLLAGCDRPADPAQPGAAAGAAATPPVLLLAPEDLRTLQPAQLAQGPLITGSVQPARRADLRAEISAVVVQVLRDNGEAVRAGDLLMRLDDTTLRDALASAEESLRAATQAFAQSERTVERLRTLQAQGMTSTQALEDAEVRRNAAQSELAAARSRVVSARQQMQRTLVRAPFDGIVSERRASTGDTAQVGKELLKVIDPRSMRFEGLVSADRLGQLQLGQAVSFRINGFGDAAFEGRIERIDAAVNTATRQVGVQVAFVDPQSAPRVAGLFAEGRIDTGDASALTLPEGAIVRAGDLAHVWRAADGRLQKVAVRLGERDPRSGEFPVLSGLAAGDRVLRNPGSALVEGQPFETAAVMAAVPSAAARATAASAPAAK
jgi:RND family efflux transporter MFP subunit